MDTRRGSRRPENRDRPRLVLITGAPWTGKSTLGMELSRAVRVPLISRDDVRGGLFFTAGSWSKRPQGTPTNDDAIEAFLSIVETTAALGVSCLVEYVVRRARPVDLQRLVAAADCRVIETQCRDSLDRFASRNREDPLLNRQPVLEALGFATIDEHTRDAVQRMAAVTADMRTEFDLPTLRVDTDAGYDPGFEEILGFVTAH